MVTPGSLLLLLAAAVSLVPNVSLCCCCLNLQCNTITRLLEAGRSVLSDRTVSTVPPLASYWPRRGWICLHTNITTLQHYITTLHYNVTPLHEGAWCQQPGVMETRSGSLLVVSVRSAHGHQCHEEARVTLSLVHHHQYHQQSLKLQLHNNV